MLTIQNVIYVICFSFVGENQKRHRKVDCSGDTMVGSACSFYPHTGSHFEIGRMFASSAKMSS